MISDYKFWDKIRDSNNKAWFGDFKCCNETPQLIFCPFVHELRRLPSISIRCYECGKQKTMEMSQGITISFEDPVLCESVKILINKWNEDENRT